ncbi:MAG: acid--CoA ligase [Candidatus Aminicenantia bacterium]
MKSIAFITDYSVIDRIINHLKLTFIAERSPSPHASQQQLSIAASPC